MVLTNILKILVHTLCISPVLAIYNTSFNPIIKPQPYDTAYAGQYFDIIWTTTTSTPVSLLLYFWGTGRNWILADNIPNTGIFQWYVSPTIAYPTLVNTPYAGDPDWFEIHIYNGSFRNTMGVSGDEYVGDASDIMEMDKGGLWFNITAPIYSVQIYEVVTAGKTVSTVSGATTMTFPVTWTTGPGSMTTSAATSGSSTVSTTREVKTRTAFGTAGESSRVPTFASVRSDGITMWSSEGTKRVLALGVALVLGAVVVL
jgi:hypothetical protein